MIMTRLSLPSIPGQTAPLRDGTRDPWRGAGDCKAWDYPAQVVIPCIDTPELVEIAIKLWRLQSVRPYICVVDTGSTPDNLAKLRAVTRADDVDLLSMDCRGFGHPSEPVSMALDMAAAVCKQQYQIHTHADAFPVSRDVVALLLDLCSKADPVVGYEISSRDHVKGFQAEHWRGMVGHTLLALHMPTIREHGIAWSMERAHEQCGVPRDDISASDTEIGFNLHLREIGITPVLIGHDENHKRQITPHYDHFRSYTSLHLYGAGHTGAVDDWAKSAIVDARARIVEWSKEVGDDRVGSSGGA